MQIIDLTLKNIKSYGPQEVTIQFQPGLNLIRGQNGAGKSTILEAIGYAVFGHDPYRPIQSFVHKGQRTGEIRVTVESRLDNNRAYQIIRGVGNSTYYVYDPETKTRRTQTADETRDWLRTHMDVDPSIDLRALFTDAIGVPQGLMTAVFLDTASERQQKFDKLLHVANYKLAFEKLKETSAYIRELQGTNQSGLDQFAGQLERLPLLEQQIRNLNAEIESAQRTVTTLSAHIDAGQSQLAQFVVLHDAVEQWKQSRDNTARNVEILEREHWRCERDVHEARIAADAVVANTEGYSAYLDAQDCLAQLDIERQVRDRLSIELQSHLNIRERQQTVLEQLVATLTDIAQAEDEQIALANQVQQQQSLESVLVEVKSAQSQLEILQSELQDYQQQSQKIENIIEALESELAQRKLVENAVNDLQWEMEQLEQRIAEVETEVTAADEQRRELQEKISQQQAREQKHQLAQERFNQASKALSTAQVELESTHIRLVERRNLQQRLDVEEADQKNHLQTQAEVQATINRVRDQLEQLTSYRQIAEEAATECPVCQQPLDEQARASSLAHYDSEIRRCNNEQELAQQALDKMAGTLKLLAKSLKQGYKALESLPSEAVLERIQTQVELHEHAKSAAAEELSDVADATDELERLTETMADLTNKVTELKQQKTEHERIRKQLAKKITAEQTKLGKLPRQEELDTQLGEKTTLVMQIETTGTRIFELSGYVARLPVIESELSQLGNPRRRYENNLELIATRNEVEANWRSQGTTVQQLTQQIEDLRTQLEAHEMLDEALEQQHARQAVNREAYTRYLQADPLAKSLGDRESEWHNTQAKLADQQKIFEDCIQQLDLAQAAYHPEQHAIAQEQLESDKNQFHKLEGQLEAKTQQLNISELEWRELSTKQEEHSILQLKAQELAERAEAMEFVRGIIRDAGPIVSERLISIIAAEANMIFSDLIGDYSLSLQWNSDYSIHVMHGGKQDDVREFKLLSGGEQMAAALSIRLALLTRLTDIRFAFFDEPTVNLDDQRRSQLAERLGLIRSLEQIFVISHDDTFEVDSQLVLRVHKTPEGSSVEVL